MTSRNLLPSYALLGQEAKGTTAEEVLANAGLDFEVKKAPSGYRNHEGDFIPHKGHSITYRADTGAALGSVGSTYKVYQNIDALKVFDRLVGEGRVEYDRIGMIDGGRKMFASMKMPEGFTVAGWDDIDQYLYMVTSHDGSTGVRYIPANVRLGCTNQFAYLDSMLRQAGINPRVLSSRHSRHIDDRINEAINALNVVDILNEQFANTAGELMQVELDVAGRTEFYIDAMGLKTDEKLIDKVENPYGLTTRGNNTLTRLQELEDTALGFDDGDINSAWGAFNVVTEYLDHQWVYDRKGEKVNQKRVESALLGTGMRQKDNAWRAAARLVA
jgi:phage/plasmid-like protein (TIGR03299 family)